MIVSPHRFVSVGIVLCVLLVGVVGARAQTEAVTSRPDQLLIAPLPLDPADFEAAKPVGLELRVYHLPDGRRAERYTLGGWLPVGDSHAFRWELAYAGIESQELLRYGGGAPRWQWTSRLRDRAPLRIAVDLAGVIPVGDATLHPLGSKAPSVQARLRISPLGGSSWRLWAGYWGQRVSPPSDRDRPLSYFPSGSGVDVACVGAMGRLHFELWWHQQLGGLRRTRWVEADFDVYAASDLALRLGAAVNPGPDDRRLFDLGWTVGLTWRPRPVGDES